MIGRSLSFCIRDIAEKKINIDDVEFIVSSTRIENDDDLEKLFELYSVVYWAKNTTKCFLTALELWRSGRIFQPRLFDEKMVQDLTDRKTWVNSIEECIYWDYDLQ